MKSARLLLALGLLAIGVSCASSDPDEMPRRMSRGDGPGGFVRSREAGIAELLPPAGWWNDSHVAAPVALRADQIDILNKTAVPQEEEIGRLEQDLGVAARELRDQVSADNPASDAIVAAGDHLRQLRDSLFDRQVKLLAMERTLLTREQWQALQEQLEASRRPQSRDNYPRRRGGMGGRGGRGPGWPG